MPEPTTPEQIPAADVIRLARAYRFRVDGLREPLSPEVRSVNVISAICFGSALLHTLQAELWRLAADALHGGDSVEQVSAALAMDPAEFPEKLASWADQQCNDGAITPEERELILWTVR